MKDTKTIIIIGIIIAIISLSVAYAAFASKLTVTGTATITKTWDVEITDIKASSTGGTAQTVADSTKVVDSKTAQFNTELEAPGDYVIYEVTVQNKGSYTAYLQGSPVLTMQPTDGENPGSKAIIYSLGSDAPASTLAAGESTTFQVRVEYDSNTTEMPEVLTRTATVVVDYSQTA